MSTTLLELHANFNRTSADNDVCSLRRIKTPMGQGAVLATRACLWALGPIFVSFEPLLFPLNVPIPLLSHFKGRNVQINGDPVLVTFPPSC